jgi:hypothetical protein
MQKFFIFVFKNEQLGGVREDMLESQGKPQKMGFGGMFGMFGKH